MFSRRFSRISNRHSAFARARGRRGMPCGVPDRQRRPACGTERPRRWLTVCIRAGCLAAPNPACVRSVNSRGAGAVSGARRGAPVRLPRRAWRGSGAGCRHRRLAPDPRERVAGVRAQRRRPFCLPMAWAARMGACCASSLRLAARRHRRAAMPHNTPRFDAERIAPGRGAMRLVSRSSCPSLAQRPGPQCLCGAADGVGGALCEAVVAAALVATTLSRSRPRDGLPSPEAAHPGLHTARLRPAPESRDPGMTMHGAAGAGERTRNRGGAGPSRIASHGKSRQLGGVRPAARGAENAAGTFEVSDAVPEIIHHVDPLLSSCSSAWPHGDQDTVIAFDLWLPYVPPGEEPSRLTWIWTDGVNDAGACIGVRRHEKRWILRVCAGNSSLLLHDSPRKAVTGIAGIACAHVELHAPIDAEGCVRHAVVAEITVRPGRIRVWVNGQLEREGDASGSSELLYGKRGQHVYHSSCAPLPCEQCSGLLRDEDALQSFWRLTPWAWRDLVLGRLNAIFDAFGYGFSARDMPRVRLSSIRQFVGLNLGQCEGGAKLHGSWVASRSHHNARLIACDGALLAPNRLLAPGAQPKVLRQGRRSGGERETHRGGDANAESSKLRYHPTPPELVPCLHSDAAGCKYLEQESFEDVCMHHFAPSQDSVLDAARCSDPYFGGSSRCCYHSLTGYCLSCRLFEASTATESANTRERGERTCSCTQHDLTSLQLPTRILNSSNK